VANSEKLFHQKYGIPNSYMSIKQHAR